ncbi:MAG TPA: A24 family peptidase [Vicinamibacterales bacterium]|nr:A24 family peptidase [Vicinamibacterales bacterium]
MLKPHNLSNVAAVSAVTAAGIASTVIDLHTRRIPNRLTLGIAVAGLTMAVTGIGLTDPKRAVAGLVLGLVLMLPGHLIGATGAGDVKLFAAIGTLLGPAGIGLAFVFTAVAGGVLAVVVAWQRRVLGETILNTATFVRTGGANVGEIERVASRNRFAYAPAIAIGAFLAALAL